MTLTILSVAFYLMPYPSTIGKAFRNSAPWVAIISLHTSIFYVPISKILEILPTFIVLYIAMFLVTNSSNIVRTAQNAANWIAILSIRPILFSILALNSLIQIQILHPELNLVIKLLLVQLCLHWPRFY